jgi:ribosomal protein S16
VAVVIRMKKMGRAHRAFFRICATDKRAPRDGRVLEELGTYDPSVPETDARAVFNQERVAHWLSVGALPSEKVAVLIKALRRPRGRSRSKRLPLRRRLLRKLRLLKRRWRRKRLPRRPKAERESP